MAAARAAAKKTTPLTPLEAESLYSTENTEKWVVVKVTVPSAEL
jgi:hypothetical protein